MIGALIGAGVALLVVRYIALAFAVGIAIANKTHVGWGILTTLGLVFMPLGAVIGITIQGGM